MYEENPKSLNLAMDIDRTQNVVILEADLSIEKVIHVWYPITTN